MGRCRRRGPFPPPGDAATRGECFAPCERQGSVMPYDTEVVDQGEERLAALWEQPLDEDVDAELADPAIRTLFATQDADQPARASRRLRRGSGASTRDRRPCWRRSRTRSSRPWTTRRAVMVATGIGAAIMLPTGVVALTGSSEMPPGRSRVERVDQPAAHGELRPTDADHGSPPAAPVQRRLDARRSPPAARRTGGARTRVRRGEGGPRRDAETPAQPAPTRAQVIAPPPVPPASSACDEFPPC